MVTFSLITILASSQAVWAQWGSWQSELEKSGITVTTEPPEEGILLFNLPNVYLLPTSPFYPLKIFWENIQLLFQEKPEEKVSFLMGLANQRLSESLKLIQQGQYKKAAGPLVAYQERFTQAENLLQLIQDDLWRERLLNLLNEQIQQQEVFAQILKQYNLAYLSTLLPKGFGLNEASQGNLELESL